VNLLTARFSIENVAKQPVLARFFDDQTGKIVFHFVYEPLAEFKQIVPVAFYKTLGNFGIATDIELPMPAFGNGFRKVKQPRRIAPHLLPPNKAAA